MANVGPRGTVLAINIDPVANRVLPKPSRRCQSKRRAQLHRHIIPADRELSPYAPSMTDLEKNSGFDEPDRKVQLVEVAVFLFLILPSMVMSFFMVSPADLRFTQIAVSSILNDLAQLSL